jgi:hypothetical protein
MLPTIVLSLAGVKGGHSHKHHWTEEELAIVRRDYQGTNRSAQVIACLVTSQAGEKITPCAVRGQVARMGISFKPANKIWTLKEEEHLGELITKYPIYEIARRMKRSKNSIRVKATRMGYSTLARDGWYTKREVCEILGVDHRRVQSWIDTGALKARPHGELHPQKNGMAMWHIAIEDLADFIKTHAVELTGRNVDLFAIIEIVSGIKGEMP